MRPTTFGVDRMPCRVHSRSVVHFSARGKVEHRHRAMGASLAPTVIDALALQHLNSARPTGTAR